MDTQFPRYYVFEQPRPDAPLIHAGSVHAPDPEMALLNARDVFARRPYRTTMWVVPAAAIFSRTKAQLEAVPPASNREQQPATPQTYQIFVKKNHKGVCTHAGEIQAPGPQQALALARRSLPNALLWWVIPDHEIVKAPPEEAPLLYESATDKIFRHESHYPVRTLMLEVKRKKSTRLTQSG